MLTHKKITDLLFKALPKFAKDDFETRFAECEAMANAIVDRVVEGVVWEKEGIAHVSGTMKSLCVHLPDPAMTIYLPREVDGEMPMAGKNVPIRMTVRRVEG